MSGVLERFFSCTFLDLLNVKLVTALGFFSLLLVREI